MDPQQLDLSKYRQEKAQDELETARIMFTSKKFSQSINRSYYAMFHAVRALLALDKFDSKKHTGIISYFNLHYIKSGKIEPEFSTILSAAFKIRNISDYNDFYVASGEDAQLQLSNAAIFLNRIKECIETEKKRST